MIMAARTARTMIIGAVLLVARHPNGADAFYATRPPLITRRTTTLFPAASISSARTAAVGSITQLSSSIISPEHQVVTASGTTTATNLVVSIQCEELNLMRIDEDEKDEMEEEPWDHIERMEIIPRPTSYREMIDAVMARYEYRGVRFADTNAVWKITSASGRFTALAGQVDNVPYPTDVFFTSEAPSSPYPCHISLRDDDDSIDDVDQHDEPRLIFSPDDFHLSFEVRCPREIRHGCSGVIGGTLFFVRAMAGSAIASAFLTAQMAALREHNPESPLAEQIESILSAPRLKTTIRNKKKKPHSSSSMQQH
jgi:hypothetical protein